MNLKNRETARSKRTSMFAFRVNESEIRKIKFLAAKLQRSRSDALRWLVGEAVREFEADNSKERNRESYGTD